jgi:hypothetical protein
MQDLESVTVKTKYYEKYQVYELPTVNHAVDLTKSRSYLLKQPPLTKYDLPTGQA